MIVKKLNSSSSFNGVRYNDKKVGDGRGELMKMQNFPSFIGPDSKVNEVRNYFKFQASASISKQAQFHYTLSAKGREYSKNDLTVMAEQFMGKMGYGKQPFLIIFHKDTKNNHVHIVSSRIDIDSGKKINDSFEGYKAQGAIQNVMKEFYNVDHGKVLDKLLSYSCSNRNQFEKLLRSNGFDCYEKEEKITITHNGMPLKSIESNRIKLSTIQDKQRMKQIYAILTKYKNTHSNAVFQVFDQKGKAISYQSELQHELKVKLGINIEFSFKDDKKPFGYIITDHKTNTIFKGSEIMKMNNLFDFTPEKISKVFFDLLTNTNIINDDYKEVLKDFLKANYNCEVKDYMLFKNSMRVPWTVFNQTKEHTIDLIRNFEDNSKSGAISIVEYNNKFYVLNTKEDKIFELKVLVGEDHYNYFLQRENSQNSQNLFQDNNQLHIVVSEKLEDYLIASSVSDLIFSHPQLEEEEDPNRKHKKRTR